MKLEVRNIVKKFKSVTAVDRISFIIERNKTLGLLGPWKNNFNWNDAGLISPTSGQIFIDGILLEKKIELDY